MKPRWLRFLIPFMAVFAMAMTLRAEEPETFPPGRKLVRIEARPAQIELKHKFDYRQVLLTGVMDNGETLDVTRMATIKDMEIVKISDRGLVRPV